MPEITFEDSCRQIHAITDRARELERAGDWDAARNCLHELIEHPCAHHQVTLYEVWDDIHELHMRAGEYDAAIAARKEAIRAGYRSEPDPEAVIAECHLLAGRRAEADALFADLKLRTPDDVWLYNSAGFSYADVADHKESARWFREGIEVALRTGDPDRVVVQLLEGLDRASTALGTAPEPGLNDRVEDFVAGWERPSPLPSKGFPDLPPSPEKRPCGHCGYEPEVRKLPASNGDSLQSLLGPSPNEQLRHLSSTVVSLAWFPQAEWQKAGATWPKLRENLPADHTEYTRVIESRMKRLARTFAGHPMRVSPMTVSGLIDFCLEDGEVPSSEQARAAYAAAIANRGNALAWPPGRNASCWCGSNRKYKACCGPTQIAAE